MKAVTKVFLVLAAVTGVISGCATKSEFKDLKERMDALESNKIQSIEGQISSIDTSIGLLDQADEQLERYIKALEEQVLTLEIECGEEREALEAAIKALQAEDESLHRQMEELKAYADTKLNGAKDWASATFVTLEEYNKTVDVIAGIQAKIDGLHSDIAKECEAAVNEAIEKTAESMKSWVNEQLTGYYDIATMNTKLDSLKSALENQISEQGGELQEQIGQNAEDIETLKSDLEETAEDITAAYKEAIEEAIDDYNGTITETIQKAIDGVDTKIQALDGRVTSLEADIKKLEDRVAALEDAIKNITSIAYIPKYTDGIERVFYTLYDFDISKAVLKPIVLRFDVYPAASAQAIVTACDEAAKDETASSPLTARAVYTLTKSAEAGDFVNLDITEVSAKDGILSIKVSTEGLGTDFIFGNLEAALVLKVAFGNNTIQSEYIPLVPKSDDNYFTKLINENDKDGDGVLSDDEKAAITELDLSDMGLTSLDLSSFTGLTQLNVAGNPNLTSLDLTKNTELRIVVCTSLDWLRKIDLEYDVNTDFYGPGETVPLLSSSEVLIDKVIWEKSTNQGTSSENPIGALYTYEEAQTACPDGWRLPTKSELVSLKEHSSYGISGAGANGRFFSGSRKFTKNASPFAFLPISATEITADNASAGYWSSTKTAAGAYYYLNVVKKGTSSTKLYKDSAEKYYVRCVRAFSD